MDAFDGIKGQPKVKSYLRKCVQSGNIAQSYLFLGPQGSNKTYAALCLAAAHLCNNEDKLVKGGNCGKCDFCTRVFNRKFPDVHIIEPEGSNGYVVEQIRQVIKDISMAPIEANNKVYIIDRVDLLGSTCANAFLKTLEEPPEDTLIILLGRTKETVLPTISSRCNCVPFRHIPPSEAALIVANKTGKDEKLSRIAIQACGGSITNAISFLNARSGSMLQLRSDLIEILKNSYVCDAWEVCKNACEMVLLIKAPCDSYLKDLERELAEKSEFLDKKAQANLVLKNKRMLSKHTNQLIDLTINVVNSVLVDVMNKRLETCDDIINFDEMDFINTLVKRSDMKRLSSALADIDALKRMVGMSVSSEVIFDNLLIYFRGVFR